MRPGSPIRAGATLATLETAPLEEALRRAEIRLEQARLAFEEALGAAALAAAGNEARINSTRAQVPTLTDAELRLAASRDAENRALAEYQKALDRPWEPEQIRESYRLAYEAEKRARQLAEADLEAVKRQQRSAAHFRWACAGMPSSRSRPAWPKGTRWWPNERNECPAADRSGPPEPALPAGWGRNSSAG